MNSYKKNEQAIIKELDVLLSKVSLDQTENYIEALLKADRVFFVGVGRVKIALESAVKRLSHLDISCHMVGDLNEPPIGPDDLLVVGSGSGESLFPKGIAGKAKEYGAKVWHLTSNPDSTIAQLADGIVAFNSPSKSSSVFTSVQPMTTVFEQGIMLYHDVITLNMIKRKDLSFDDLRKRHANLE